MEKDNDFKRVKTITGILDILICLLLFITALYKGAFYKEDGLFVNVVICMLGLVCLSVKLVLNIRDNRKIIKSKLATVVDICVMLMPITFIHVKVKLNTKELQFIVRRTVNTEKKIYLPRLQIRAIRHSVISE